MLTLNKTLHEELKQKDEQLRSITNSAEIKYNRIKSLNEVK